MVLLAGNLEYTSFDDGDNTDIAREIPADQVRLVATPKT